MAAMLNKTTTLNGLIESAIMNTAMVTMASTYNNGERPSRYKRIKNDKNTSAEPGSGCRTTSSIGATKRPMATNMLFRFRSFDVGPDK